MKFSTCVAGTAAFVCFCTGTLLADSNTANLTVSATVVANCTIGTTALTFGNYDAVVTNASSPLNGTGAINVTCTFDSPTKITLDQGANQAGGSTDAVPLRRMAAGGQYLNYSLYSDNSRTVTWGNTSGTGVDYTGTGSAGSLTIYGSVTAGQNTVPVGSYSDTVVATITF
jgi:spore coat protein U-like protein